MGPLRIGCDPPQPAAELGLFGLVGRFQIALVLDRLGLNVFQRDPPALPIVAVELRFPRPSVPDPRQPGRKIDGIRRSCPCRRADC